MNPELERLYHATPLSRGNHAESSPERCAMEMVALLAGEPHSDCPPCASRLLAAFVVSVNDFMSDVDRQRLKPFIPAMIGTRDGRDDERGRIIVGAAVDMAFLAIPANQYRIRAVLNDARGDHRRFERLLKYYAYHGPLHSWAPSMWMHTTNCLVAAHTDPSSHMVGVNAGGAAGAALRHRTDRSGREEAVVMCLRTIDALCNVGREAATRSTITIAETVS